jgi:hypothetical protein
MISLARQVSQVERNAQEAFLVRGHRRRAGDENDQILYRPNAAYPGSARCGLGRDGDHPDRIPLVRRRPAD